MFIAWLVLFPAVILPIRLFPNLSLKISVSILLFLLVMSIYLLVFIIYKGEYVYWYTGGPSYEEAKSAGSTKRKEYAKAHLDLFRKMTLISSLYLLLSFFFYFSIYIDILIVSLAIVLATLKSTPIKFNKEK